MGLDHASELVVGLKPTPLELVDPAVEEPPRAGLGLVSPKVIKRLLEQMSFQQLAAGAQEIVERLPGLASDVGLPGKQDELPAKSPLKRPAALWNSAFLTLLRASRRCRMMWNLS